jgi:hypothetical protein
VVPKDDVLDLKVGVQEDQDFKFSMMINIWDNETGVKPTDLDRIGYMWYGLRENQYWPDWGAQLTWTRLPYHTCTKDDLNSFPEKILDIVIEADLHSWVCLDEGSDIDLYTNDVYNSKHLYVSFEPCYGEEYNCYNGTELDKRRAQISIDMAYTYQSFNNSDF